jgi:hypothetical protein
MVQSTMDDIIYINEIPPIIEDVVENIISKCKVDLEDENNNKKTILDKKQIKIKEAYTKEKKQLTKQEESIADDKKSFKKLNISYIIEKGKTNKIIKQSNNNKQEYKDLLNIYNEKIKEYNRKRKIISDKVSKEYELHLNNKNTQTETLKSEIDIYNIEIDRIKNQKLIIEQELQHELAQIIKDLESIDIKIDNKNRMITLLQLEIKKIEKGNTTSRRQIIKHNKIFINKTKNFKKVKKNIQDEIAEYHLAIYNLDQQRNIELDELAQISERLEKEHRQIINSKHLLLNQLTDSAEELKAAAVNTSSKTWMVNMKKISDEVNELHSELTKEIQNFNNYLNTKNNKISDITNQYNYDIDNKKQKLKLLEAKLKKMESSADNKVSKLNHQYQLNNRLVLQKQNELKHTYDELQQLYKNKYNFQRMANKYEQDSNIKIDQLGKDLDRAQDRLHVITKRYKDTIEKLENQYNDDISEYNKQFNKIDNATNKWNQTIKKLTKSSYGCDKNITDHNNGIKEIRRNIKDVERQIKSDQSRLETMTIKVNDRLKTIKERENDVIEQKIKQDLEYINKRNALEKIANESVEKKIETLNKIMGIKIDY